MPLLDRQQAFGYTQEDIKFLLTPMALNGEEPIGSMGNDSPLAVLSNKNKTLYHYFKQLFAQVTNPPIDPIREELVTSLVSFIGPKPNLLGIDEMNPPLRLEVSQPVLDFYEMEKIRHIERYTDGKFKSLRARHHLPGRLGQGGDRGAARVACARRPRTRCARATRSSSSPTARSTATASRSRRCSRCRRSTSIWSTRACAPAPAWWSRPARRAKCTTSRCSAATAPRRCIRTSRSRRCSTSRSTACSADVDGKKAIKNYVKAIGKGLKKVMSKMGISTYMSYTGAQIFEAVGLSRALVDKYFTGTTSNVEGIGVFEVAEEAIRIHRAAFGERSGARQARSMPAASTPGACAAKSTCGRRTRSPSCSTRRGSNSYATYKEYAQIINDQSQRHMTFRGLFEFRFDQCTAGADRGSRAGRRDRQALLDRRHVARLDFDRGAHHARRSR